MAILAPGSVNVDRPMMDVLINGKPARREVDYVQLARHGRVGRSVPVLRPGERLLAHIPGCPPYIARDM